MSCVSDLIIILPADVSLSFVPVLPALGCVELCLARLHGKGSRWQYNILIFGFYKTSLISQIGGVLLQTFLFSRRNFSFRYSSVLHWPTYSISTALCQRRSNYLEAGKPECWNSGCKGVDAFISYKFFHLPRDEGCLSFLSVNPCLTPCENRSNLTRFQSFFVISEVWVSFNQK